METSPHLVVSVIPIRGNVTAVVLPSWRPSFRQLIKGRRAWDLSPSYRPSGTLVIALACAMEAIKGRIIADPLDRKAVMSALLLYTCLWDVLGTVAT